MSTNKNLLDSIKKNRVFFLMGCLALLQFIAMIPIIQWIMTPDGYDYLAMVDIYHARLIGLEYPPSYYTINPKRFFRPLIPLLATPFSFLVDSFFSIFIVNMILFTLTVVGILSLSYHFSSSNTIAITSCLIFQTSYYVLAFAISPLTETGSWFIIVYTVLFGIRRGNSEKKNNKIDFFLGLFLGLGTLIKEFVVVGAFWLIYYNNRDEFTKKFRLKSLFSIIKKEIYLIIAVFIPIIINLSILFINFDLSIIEYFFSEQSWGATKNSSGTFNIINFLISFWRGYWYAFGPGLFMSVLVFIKWEHEKYTRKDLFVIWLIFFVPNFLVHYNFFYHRFAALTYIFFIMLTPYYLKEKEEYIQKRMGKYSNITSLFIYSVVLMPYIFFIFLLQQFRDLIYVRILEYAIIGILSIEIIIQIIRIIYQKKTPIEEEK